MQDIVIIVTVVLVFSVATALILKSMALIFRKEFLFIL